MGFAPIGIVESWNDGFKGKYSIIPNGWHN